jgi:autotransporter translocation and assembly factor TamB
MIAGTWKFTLDTPGGVREIGVVLEQNGDRISGTWDKSSAVKGTFAGGKLELAFPIQTQEAGNGTIRITGSMQGQNLAGKWEFQSYDGTFKATREK